jgi:hypothetical protein
MRTSQSFFHNNRRFMQNEKFIKGLPRRSKRKNTQRTSPPSTLYWDVKLLTLATTSPLWGIEATVTTRG